MLVYNCIIPLTSVHYNTCTPVAPSDPAPSCVWRGGRQWPRRLQEVPAPVWMGPSAGERANRDTCLHVYPSARHGAEAVGGPCPPSGLQSVWPFRAPPPPQRWAPTRPISDPAARTPCCCFRSGGFTLAKIWIVCFIITNRNAALTLDLSKLGLPKTSYSHLVLRPAALATVTKDATQAALRPAGSRLLYPNWSWAKRKD